MICATAKGNSVKMANKNPLSDVTGGQHSGSTTVYNPQVPLVQNKLGNIETGKVFYISGIPSKNPKRIRILLEAGNEVALNIGIRFNFDNDRNVIIRKAKHDNGWGQAERSLSVPFPFQADAYFDMMILIESSCFKVAVKNQPVFEFMHRIPFHRIDTLRIIEDVRLCQVRF